MQFIGKEQVREKNDGENLFSGLREKRRIPNIIKMLLLARNGSLLVQDFSILGNQKDTALHTM